MGRANQMPYRKITCLGRELANKSAGSGEKAETGQLAGIFLTAELAINQAIEGSSTYL